MSDEDVSLNEELLNECLKPMELDHRAPRLMDGSSVPLSERGLLCRNCGSTADRCLLLCAAVGAWCCTPCEVDGPMAWHTEPNTHPPEEVLHE